MDAAVDPEIDSVHDLRVEYLVAPNGLGTACPRFTWLPGGAQRSDGIDARFVTDEGGTPLPAGASTHRLAARS